MARSPRLSATSRHMVVAMLVLLIPVIGITVLFTRTPEPVVTDVAYAPIAQRAAVEADYPLLAPAQLADGWVCTKAEWLPAGTSGRADPVIGDTWSMAFLNPDRMYVGLDQRVEAPEDFIASRTQDGVPDGASTVAGETWVRYVSGDGGTHALVLVDAAGEGPVTVVSGDLPYADLESFAATLEPVA